MSRSLLIRCLDGRLGKQPEQLESSSALSGVRAGRRENAAAAAGKDREALMADRGRFSKLPGWIISSGGVDNRP